MVSFVILKEFIIWQKNIIRIISDFAGSFLTLTKNNIVSKFSDVCIVSFNGNKSVTGGVEGVL